MSILVTLPEQLYSKTAFAGFSEDSKPTLATARAMMWMSQLAYETGDPDKITHIRSLWGIDKIQPFMQRVSSNLPMSKTHGLVATKGGSVIVTFAGTDPLVLYDWIADFRTLSSTDGIHEGFQDAANAVWAEIKSAIEETAKAGRSLFITGHSLGGALAVVAAERAVRQEKLIGAAQIYTFGMPRVGKEEFVERYLKLETTTYRFVHGQALSRRYRLRNLASGMSGVQWSARAEAHSRRMRLRLAKETRRR